MSPNSLYGAMTIGGIALAIRLRQRWPHIRLNETHPKVLGFALRGELHRDTDTLAVTDWFFEYSGLGGKKI